ncbi:MAG: undecaprenyl phosphate translocase family protein [Clostridia bacterium]
MKALILFLKGIGVGIATLVPGVSGGTMAIILGVYDRLIHSISSFFKSWKENLLFLLILGCGGATSLLYSAS